MPLAYLSLGTNLGDRDHYLELARLEIMEKFVKVRFSRIYETEPVEFTDQPWFLNQVVEVQTDLRPESLLEWAQSVEKKMGRQREVPKGPRTLDIDILMYGDEVRRSDRLTLPHPSMLDRRHVLVPLADLSPEMSIPSAGLSVREAYTKVKDRSQVKLHAPS